MKKEHTEKEQAFLKYLESKNCWFYSPMSYTDTTDWISGNDILYQTSASKTWDSVNKVWKLQKVSNSPSYYAWCYLKNPITASQVMKFTGIGRFISYNQAGQNPNVWDFLPNMYGLALGVNQINTICNTAQSFPYINGSTVQYNFRDGELVGTYNYNTTLYTKYSDRVMFGWVNRNYTFGLKNFAIFPDGFMIDDVNEYFSKLP